MAKKINTMPVAISYREERDNKDPDILRCSVIFSWQREPEGNPFPDTLPLLIGGRLRYYDLADE